MVYVCFAYITDLYQFMGIWAEQNLQYEHSIVAPDQTRQKIQI